MKLLFCPLTFGTMLIDTLIQGFQVLIDTSEPRSYSFVQSVMMKTQIGQLFVDPSHHLGLHIDHTSVIHVNPPDLDTGGEGPWKRVGTCQEH